MRVHHLNCGTLRPLGRRMINGDGSPFRAGRLVCHCLLGETDAGLVLVDTGFGLVDVERRGGAGLVQRGYAKLATRPRLDPEETAVRQVERLGYTAGDVRHVVLTHLDLDHASGLPDFPHARVHVTAAEHGAAMQPRSRLERFRYRPHHWSHDPDWVLYGPGGDTWFGVAGVRELDGLPGLALVPLPGHTRGHAGVAVETGRRWLLHAGDAYFFHGEVDRARPHSTPGLAGFQKRFEVDAAARRESRARVRELDAQVERFCSHDPIEFDRY